jgi:hypothetical protein
MISDRLTLVRMDLLELRRRRGLMGIALLIAVASVSVIFAARAISHGVNPTRVGPAGGIKTFEGVTDFVGVIGVVLAAMIGVAAGAADAELGLLRDVVATGRSRVALFASHAVAALLLRSRSWPRRSSLPQPCRSRSRDRPTCPRPRRSSSATRPSWDSAPPARWSAPASPAFVRTRGRLMASVIALGVVISDLLLRTSFLVSLRALLPLGAFDRAVGGSITGLHISWPSQSRSSPLGHSPRWPLAAGGPDESRSERDRGPSANAV